MNESIFNFLVNFIVFICTAVLSYFLTFFFIQASHKFDFLDYPSGRKIHAKPMPFLGGVGIFCAFWIVILTGFLIVYFVMQSPVDISYVYEFLSSVLRLFPMICGVLLGSVVILVTGLLDDKFKLSPGKKLLGQIIAASILMSLGLTINFLAGFGLVGQAITFIWILLIMNAFNFIDSLDGHCAGIAIISAIVFFWVTQIISQPLVGIFLIAFAGAVLGFFPHNFKPAKIFLGDNGSLFIGYMMAAFTLICSYQVPKPTYATVFIPVLIFGVPIYDTLSVVAVRLFRGLPPWEGDRNHFAHRLVKIGMNEKVAVIFSYFVAIMLGLVAILTTQVDLFGAIIIGLLFLSNLGAIAFLEFYTTERIRIVEELAKQRRRRKEDIQEAEDENF